MLLKLKEILWEVTLKCNKNCTFCGSAKYINDGKELDIDKIDAIVDNILSYPPEEITFTGGEPLFGLGKNKLEEIMEKFWLAGIKIKILTNGYLINEYIGSYDRLSIITAIGWSLNSAIECNAALEIMEKHQTTFDFFKDRCVPITNFGTHNIFDFDKMLKILTLNTSFKVWQVQLTEGNNFQLNSTGIAYLKKKIIKVNSTMPNFKIIEADNLLPNSPCNAGINSASITRDGLLIPCLSARSWCKFPVEELSEGNLLDKKLQDIWELGFRRQRFQDCPCCKNYVDYPNLDEPEVQTTDEDHINYLKDRYKQQKQSIFVYGVIDPTIKESKIFKKTKFNIRVVYAVVNPNNWSSSSENYTITSNTNKKEGNITNG